MGNPNAKHNFALFSNADLSTIPGEFEEVMHKIHGDANVLIFYFVFIQELSFKF